MLDYDSVLNVDFSIVQTHNKDINGVVSLIFQSPRYENYKFSLTT